MIFRKQRQKYLDTEMNIEAIDTLDTEIKMTTLSIFPAYFMFFLMKTKWVSKLGSDVAPTHQTCTTQITN